MKAANKQNQAPKINSAVAFKLGSNILEKWQCSASDKQAILGLSKSSYYRFNHNESASLSNDQLERISYIANIHQALKMVFSNPDNVYGFMAMKNDNPYFNGHSPLSLISSGNFGTLYEVFKRIDAMRNGQW
ncbi:MULTISPECIES: antitoxin Xre-like helix-turn-helix domain-containing protein [unclassified Colwellia]|jgi:uncharacterized protein (DUF2384 family)|uniref:antitoxin Xre-like helix-turn-helix domain-containing protein n=1 Tax=unclassified Colwellia TaxID=196834 RepID=UPI0015F59711|nr:MULTISPECIES: antitoxin Xre-like helix-turn-helix domain-containing protein [unclassified Colwellia]MBA6225210.1 DUF2384 domain-containing protein [Colwellia sp. MB3u-45]MBA6266321.1 DUF2384 domain-containing protein [Colwellia sp. MB3u-43]MBA6288849.1 DUF2384 domain-containing protein [Colwellia sp. MB3u-4]MBA6297272.1 DUF2384 domain-containing protein [Colwellia sp. MB02u-9]MBA6322952.1 DUF2384 domain-containing protein [Colwellia sp. MB02u-19]